jgi:chromosomal replication initiator protein
MSLVSVNIIKRVIATRYNLKIGAMDTPKRTRNVARPRQIAMYLARKMTTRSLPDIGRRFGGRHHTTVLHAQRQIESLMALDVEFMKEITTAEDAIRAEALIVRDREFTPGDPLSWRTSDVRGMKELSE